MSFRCKVTRPKARITRQTVEITPERADRPSRPPSSERPRPTRSWIYASPLGTTYYLIGSVRAQERVP
jgi:hypothetical protein